VEEVTFAEAEVARVGFGILDLMTVERFDDLGIAYDVSYLGRCSLVIAQQHDGAEQEGATDLLRRLNGNGVFLRYRDVMWLGRLLTLDGSSRELSRRATRVNIAIALFGMWTRYLSHRDRTSAGGPPDESLWLRQSLGSRPER
jgi:hypothetical protein